MPQLLHHPSGLYTDLYQLTMAQGYFLNGRAKEEAVFDYFFRDNPYKGGYTIFAGLSDLLDMLTRFRFDEDALQYLKNQGFDPGFIRYLSDFRFDGHIHGVREGEVVFPNAPLVRVEGNIIATQLVETLVLNILNFESLIATKAARIREVAGERLFADFGLRRAHGLGGVHASRAAVIGGADATSNVFSGLQFGLPVTGTQGHSWIQSFDSELEAFRAYAKAFPDNCVLLVDTYNTLQSGIPNAISVAGEMRKAGGRLKGVRLDSGDLAYLSKKARAMLDEAEMQDVKIIVSNQLDEYVIRSLIHQQKAPIDGFGVGTELVTGGGSGALDGVYKLSFCGDKPRMKISENIAKVTLPGRKQTVRFLDEDGRFYADGIILEHERKASRITHPVFPEKQTRTEQLTAEPLFQKWMEGGKPVGQIPQVADSAAYAQQRLKQLPSEHRRFEYPHIYKVGVSPAVRDLRDKVMEHIKNPASKQE